MTLADDRMFMFGRNWARFLGVLDDERIAIAQQSLQTMLNAQRLDGLSFLDIGAGSGLFSLCARRLGATVLSFDCDPQSVECVRELKRRYCPEDPSWTTERGSALDQTYLATLGTFDVVYAWGVLHHTGEMWRALDNIKPLVKMGGRLFIAIYNDLGEVTDQWAKVKQTYGKLPGPLAMPYALTIIASQECRAIAGHWRDGGMPAWLRSWTQYARQSARGMSKWYDWIDWIGGYPYERATLEQVVDHCANDGFRLVNVVDRSQGYGCNEFVFSRDGPMGTRLSTRMPGGTSLVRRFGAEVRPPFELTSDGWTGHVEQPSIQGGGDGLWLFKGDNLLGPARLAGAGRVFISRIDRMPDESRYFLLAGQVRKPCEPFRKVRGRSWMWQAPDLSNRADSADDPTRSSVFLLQDGTQLARPHAPHCEIARRGDGRFSHWGTNIYFAPRRNEDPRAAPDRFSLFIPPDGVSFP